MTPEQAAELYAEDCRHRRQKADTVRTTLSMLERFAEYCRLHKLEDLRDATAETLPGYYRWLGTRKRTDGLPWSTANVNRHLRMAKSLFAFLAARHMILSDVGKDFPPLRDPKALPRGILTKEEMTKLLQQPPLTTPLGFRDRVILEVFYSTGVRGGELCRLSLYDYDAQERTLRVLGKGNKDRVVPVGKIAAGYLAEYLGKVRPVLVGANPYAWLFLSATGRRLRTGDLHKILRTYREQAGLPDNVTVHSLRHTCATEMLKGGASIRHVQELLGHSDIQTTQIYTHVVPTDLKKAHARTAPSERRQTPEDVRFPAYDNPKWPEHRQAPFYRLKPNRKPRVWKRKDPAGEAPPAIAPAEAGGDLPPRPPARDLPAGEKAPACRDAAGRPEKPC